MLPSSSLYILPVLFSHSRLQAPFYQLISLKENMEMWNIIQHRVRKVYLFLQVLIQKKKIDYVPSKLLKY